MSLARKIERARTEARRKRGAKAIQRIRKERTIAAWHEALEDRALAAELAVPDDLEGVDPHTINSTRRLAGMAAACLVLLYILAAVASGC